MIPVAPEATVYRPWSNADIVILKPSPSSPMRFCSRHTHILEADPPGAAGSHTQLAVEVAARDAGRDQIDNEGGEPIRVRAPPWGRS